MSLLTPVRVPVRVYKWNDVDAPALNKTANCVSEIFKSCLVTGYGVKEGAGWAVPFEEVSIKVLHPPTTANTDFYLRLSADSGTQVTAQVYTDMTDANNGTLSLQCATAFKYAKNNSTGKWLLIASDRGFWFFAEQRYNADVGKTGCWFFVGDVPSATNTVGDAVFLQHTGGNYDDGDFASILGITVNQAVDKNADSYVVGKLLTSTGVVLNAETSCGITGVVSITNEAHLTPLYIVAQKEMYLMTGAYAPFNGAAANNFDTFQTIGGGVSETIVFGTSGRINSNLHISTDSWGY